MRGGGVGAGVDVADVRVVGVAGGVGAGRRRCRGLLVDAGVRLRDGEARLIAQLVGEGHLPAAQQQRRAQRPAQLRAGRKVDVGVGRGRRRRLVVDAGAQRPALGHQVEVAAQLDAEHVVPLLGDGDRPDRHVLASARVGDEPVAFDGERIGARPGLVLDVQLDVEQLASVGQVPVAPAAAHQQRQRQLDGHVGRRIRGAVAPSRGDVPEHRRTVRVEARPVRLSVLWVTMFAGTICPANPNSSDGVGRNQAPTIALKVSQSEPRVCARMSSVLDTGLTAPGGRVGVDHQRVVEPRDGDPLQRHPDAEQIVEPPGGAGGDVEDDRLAVHHHVALAAVLRETAPG